MRKFILRAHYVYVALCIQLTSREMRHNCFCRKFENFEQFFQYILRIHIFTILLYSNCLTFIIFSFSDQFYIKMYDFQTIAKFHFTP